MRDRGEEQLENGSIESLLLNVREDKLRPFCFTEKVREVSWLGVTRNIDSLLDNKYFSLFPTI